jgi:hypothetical protein
MTKSSKKKKLKEIKILYDKIINLIELKINKKYVFNI